MIALPAEPKAFVCECGCGQRHQRNRIGLVMLPGSERKAIIFRGHVSAFVREQTQIQTLEALVANLRRLWFWQRSKSPDIAAIRNLAVQIRVRNHGQAYAEREAKRTVLLAILPSFIGQPLFRMWASAAKHRSLKFPHHRKEKV